MITYYKSGKSEPMPPKGEQKECKTCAPVSGKWNGDTFDTERDAQIAWQYGAVNFLNEAIKDTWEGMWDFYKCVVAGPLECKTKESCSDTPSYIEAGVENVERQDASAPRGKKMVWQLTVLLQRKIQCVPKDKALEKDEKPKKFDTLPPEEKQKSPDKKSPGEDPPPNPEGHGLPTVAGRDATGA